MKNTANKLRIVHRGVAQLHNGESAQPGLAAVLTNMREREDALEVVGNPRSIDQLELGDSMLLVDDDRTLVLRDGNVVWNNVVVLNTAATVISAHKVGAMLVVVTSEGNVVMRRTASGYSTLNIDSALPQLHLSAVEQQAMTTTIPAFEFDQPYTAWQAPLATADVEAYSRLVRNAVATMQRSAASQGRFTGVMLVRYAVRLWDDSYLWVSQPLMVGHSLISANYRSTATVTSSNNRFTGTEAFSLEVNSYRLGISVAQGIAAEWRDVVKAIDVMVMPQAALVDLNSLDYRCVVTTSSGTRRYLLEVGLKPRSVSAIVQQAMAGDWRVVASTACLDGSAFTAVNTAMASQQVLPGVRCDVVASQLLNPRVVSQQHAAQAMECSTLRPVSSVAMEHNGRLYQAPSSFTISNPWHVLPWLDGTLSAGSVTATVQVTLATSEGAVVVTKSLTCLCSGTALNPIIAFPDVRATHIAIAVGNKVWESDLEPIEAMGIAAFINPSLHSNSLVTGTLPPANAAVAAIPTQGTILVSAVGNPLVTQWRAAVSGCAIRAMGAACRPIYSGGFGRYPIYLFTTQGIMALPQTTSGSYGEPRLITETVLAQGSMPVAGGDALWFVSQHGILCSISGSILTRHLDLSQLSQVSQLSQASRLSPSSSPSKIEGVKGSMTSSSRLSPSSSPSKIEGVKGSMTSSSQLSPTLSPSKIEGVKGSMTSSSQLSPTLSPLSSSLSPENFLSPVIAWNDRERELWIAGPDGHVVVLMPSGRTYSRDISVHSLYSDPQHALAVTAEGALLDLATEESTSQQVNYLSHPFELDPLMSRRLKRIVWNFFSQTVPPTSVTLTLRGERGSSCHGYIINKVRASGTIAAPLSRPLIAPPTRILRLQVSAAVPSGTLLLPTQLY